MIQIKELKRVVESVDNDGTQVSKLPSNQQMFDKINEIIRVVNGMNNKDNDLDKLLSKKWIREEK